MDYTLKQDIKRFFSVYQNNISGLIAPLHPLAQKEIEEELDALKISVLRRLAAELGD